MFLTGDLHFYKRHENAEGIQKITSGGGGAFLHPTHAPATKQLAQWLRASARRIRTRRPRDGLAWRNLLFPFINPKSGWLYAFLYAMSAWLASASLEASDVIDLPTALAAAMNAAIRDPLNGMWLVTIVARIHLLHRHARSLVAHPGRRLPRAAAPGGGVPGRLAARCCSRRRDSIWRYGSIPQLLISGLVTFLLGAPVGRVHPRRLSIRLDPHFRTPRERGVLVAAIQDFKQWLRLRIDASGGLTIHAIAIDRVPRRWRSARRGGEATLEADDARASAPRLIDRVELRP